jgi:hypothetical protein
MRTFLPSAFLSFAAAAALGLSAAPARADDTRSRWVAAIPFGAGQFQDGDVGLGVFFAAGEALLGGASIATVLADHALGSTNVSSFRSSSNIVVSIDAINARISGVATANRIFFAGWAALTVAGVIEAEVTFSRRDTRDASGPTLTAGVAPVPGGAAIALRATF